MGSNNKMIKVDECSPRVLARVVDFIYGIEIAEEDFNCEDSESLLAMADLYLMTDLKDAVGSLIGSKQMNKENILGIFQMAERYSAQKLKEMCCRFIFQNLQTLDKELLTQLYETFPWLEIIEGALQNSVDVANKVLGINLTDNPFKKRGDFKSDLEYNGYMMTHLKPNMLVVTNREAVEFKAAPYSVDEDGQQSLSEGTIGRVHSSHSNPAKPFILWSNGGSTACCDLTALDILAPPIAHWLRK